jgi:FkbM family methyltransferase
MNNNITKYLNSKHESLDITTNEHLSSVRCVHHFTLPSGNRYNYCELNHVNESTRNLLEDYKYYAQTANWERYCTKGTLAIDIGSHTGDTSIIMAELVGAEGVVLAFEPNPRVFPILALNAKLNSSVNIVPLELAVTKEHNVEVQYIDHGNGMCNGGLAPKHFSASDSLRAKIMDNNNAQSIIVNGINLAMYIEEKKSYFSNFDVSFIKIDCEGYDKEIIRASADFIKTKKPIIFCEWFAWFTEDETQDLFNVIENVIEYVPLNPVTLARQTVKEYIPDLLLVPKGDYVQSKESAVEVEVETLCIAMMGNNSHHLIKDKLKELISACDEFIYLDQESTDETKKLLQSCFREQDVLIEQSKSILFNDGFGCVRNVMKAAAKSNWILFLDTDEYIDISQIPKFKLYLSAVESNVIGLKRLNLNATFEHYQNSNMVQEQWLLENYDKHQANPPEIQIRVCRNLDSIKWEGFIHEELYEDESASFYNHVVYENINILHLHGLLDHNDAIKKNLFYSYLLYKSLIINKTKGTNQFWYITYFMNNRRAIMESAFEFMRQNNLESKETVLVLENVKSIEDIFTHGNFTNDWFSPNVNALSALFDNYLPGYSQKPIQMLEIGSFEGLSSCWFLNNILTHADSRLTCIDTFEGSDEHKILELKNLHTIFLSNIVNTGLIEKINVEVGSSHDILSKLKLSETVFDVIYVDGAHTAFDVLADAVMSFYLLKAGGIMIFDDYLWPGSVDISFVPKAGIDAFINIFYSQIEILPNTRNYQIQIRKK